MRQELLHPFYWWRDGAQRTSVTSLTQKVMYDGKITLHSSSLDLKLAVQFVWSNLPIYKYWGGGALYFILVNSTK